MEFQLDGPLASKALVVWSLSFVLRWIDGRCEKDKEMFPFFEVSNPLQYIFQSQFPCLHCCLTRLPEVSPRASNNPCAVKGQFGIGCRWNRFVIEQWNVLFVGKVTEAGCLDFEGALLGDGSKGKNKECCTVLGKCLIFVLFIFGRGRQNQSLLLP